MASTPLLTDSVNQTYSAGSSMGQDSTVTPLVGDIRTHYSAIIPHSTTNKVLPIRFNVADLVGIDFKSSGALSITNGTDNITLTANTPKIWFKPAAAIFTVDTGHADANAFKVTNASGTVDATVVFFVFADGSND
jgi:hypothetical protein